MTELKAAVWPPYTFKNEALCAAALRHPSVVGKRKNGDEHFERLEFLGDRVVGLVVGDLLLEPCGAGSTIPRCSPKATWSTMRRKA